MQDLQLVIFDCDGVLVDSLSLACGVLARMLTDQGLPTTLADARRDYQELLLADVVSRVECKLGRRLPSGWLERYELERAEAFRQGLTPIAGAADAVRRISAAGIPVCVASQGRLEKTRLSLELTGLWELFHQDVLFSAYSVPRGKPHPDIFVHAAAAMKAEPSRCVVIEDTPSGVTAAVSAGMKVFAYAADSDELALHDAGGEILWSLEDLPARLDLLAPGRSTLARRLPGAP
jgi:HAD superfamily hydrolase (TIGR01509 family)